MDMEKKQFVANLCLTSVYNMLPGGGQFRHRNSKIVTFFRCVIRTG